MLQRLYVNNYRCLENFELNLKDMPSALLIGKNGAGKSTIASVLEIFQNIGRDINKVKQLVTSKDFVTGRSDILMRFEIEVLLKDKLYKYILVLELPETVQDLRVLEEKLLISGDFIYSREESEVALYAHEVTIGVNGRVVALPIIQEPSKEEPLRIFKAWLAQMIILSPIPSLITGESTGETLEPKQDGSNFAEWVSGLLSRYPAAYSQIDKYLRELMPDIHGFLNEPIGKNAKSIVLQFKANNATLSIDFEDLSDGEKCFFLCAIVLGANHYYGSLFCFWDEPDNYLSVSEVGHFVMELRRAFKSSGQILTTPHNEEAIRKFSDENTFVLDRKSHLEPSLIRRLSDLSFGSSGFTGISKTIEKDKLII